MHASDAKTHPHIHHLETLARREIIDFGEGSLCWRGFGSGPPVILLHGGHGSWRHWVNNIEALAANRGEAIAKGWAGSLTMGAGQFCTNPGIAVVIDGRAYTRQRIVEVGVNLNEVSTLDTANQTFNADFFIWLRYQGSDDAADIAFPNALNPDLDPGDPVRKTTVGDDTYVLYAVEGEFSSSMQFN